jgi:hypothetical protein
MNEMKQIVGVKVRNQECQGYDDQERPIYRPVVCEVLEADGDVLRYRTTYEDNSETYESLWSPENPTVLYPGYTTPFTVVRTWHNGIEMSQEQAEGYDLKDFCLCTVLHHLYGNEFTEYHS